jgi:hypothetical protein
VSFTLPPPSTAGSPTHTVQQASGLHHAMAKNPPTIKTRLVCRSQPVTTLTEPTRTRQLRAACYTTPQGTLQSPSLFWVTLAVPLQCTNCGHPTPQATVCLQGKLQVIWSCSLRVPASFLPLPATGLESIMLKLFLYRQLFLRPQRAPHTHHTPRCYQTDKAVDAEGLSVSGQCTQISAIILIGPAPVFTDSGSAVYHGPEKILKLKR